MPTDRFVVDPARLNFTLQQSGKEYNLRLAQRAQVLFTNLMNLLPSNYISTVQGPNYSLELKAMAVELARLELALEDVDLDNDFRSTRSDFLYGIIGYLVFLNGKLPSTSFDDNEFKKFLLNVIQIYFQGSVPTSIREGVQLFISQGVTITENYLLIRSGASGFDISDQFGFQIAIDSINSFPTDIFDVDSNVRLILNVLRPAHTLFTIRYVFKDSYTPNSDSGGKILDSSGWAMSSYYYDDLRKYALGLKDIDRLGRKANMAVTSEAHSMDF